MRIAIGCDHGGFDLKDMVIGVLKSLGHEVEDKGTYSRESVDYPDFAREVCGAVTKGECQRGILICGTGIGMSIAANKIRGIRAALCHDVYSAKLTRQHNDSNVLVMGARVIGPGLAEEITRAWLEGAFEGGRHIQRLRKVAELEDANL